MVFLFYKEGTMTFLYIVEIFSGIMLTILILLHAPKGEGLGAIGGASQLFSSQKSAEKGLNKVTYIFAGIFVILALVLSLLSK